MHWFILAGGMFTESQPDSAKAKHMLQHEKPPSPSLPQQCLVLCPVYTAALSSWHHHFPFDKSNFTRQTQHFSWPQIKPNSLRDCSIGREAFRLPPPDICHEGQITLVRWGTMEKKKWTMRSLEDFIWYNFDNRTWKWMHCSQSLSFSK